MRISDNGVGCADPQMIFEKHTSAWDDVDEAFGEGFFLIFMVADWLTIRSHDWELELDILEMLETHDLTIEPQDGLDHVDGFTIEMTGKALDDNAWLLRDRVRSLGSMIAPRLSLNGSMVDKVQIDELREGEWKFENEYGTYYLAPKNGFGGEIRFYYDSRPVMERYYTAVRGRAILKTGGVTPKAPDRRDLVRNDAFYDMDRRLRHFIRDMYLEELKTATPTFLDHYAKAIQEYIPVNEYAEILPLPASLVQALQDEKWNKLLSKLNIHNDLNESNQVDRDPKITVGDVDTEYHEPSWLDQLEHAHVTLDDLDPDEVPQESELAVGEYTRMKDLLDVVDTLVWVPHSKVAELQEAVKDAEYKGYGILYPTNDMYESALTYLGIMCVTDLNMNVEERVEYTKVGPRSKKERRFMVLMSIVEKGLDLPPGTIQLGSLSMTFVEKKSGKELRTVSIEGVSRAEGIIIDRKVVDFPNYRAQAPDYPNITNHDFKALMRALVVIAHEVGHYRYGYSDNTVEHNASIQQISREIAELF